MQKREATFDHRGEGRRGVPEGGGERWSFISARGGGGLVAFSYGREEKSKEDPPLRERGATGNVSKESALFLPKRRKETTLPKGELACFTYLQEEGGGSLRKRGGAFSSYGGGKEYRPRDN